MSGKIYVVGFGSGKKDFMTQEAVSVLENADLIVGYNSYTEIIKKVFPEKQYFSNSMGKESERCRFALEKADEGKTVAVVSSGDSGIYGMAGIIMQIADEINSGAEIVPVAGVTAASLAASALGAPIMHDFSVISLSDIMTPLEKIYKRIRCAAEGDFVICIYNPKSKKRAGYLEKSSQIIMQYRNKNTPVGIVRNAGREDMKVWFSTLENLKNEDIDMFCTVIIGNSQTYLKNGKMITPRGYRIAGKL